MLHIYTARFSRIIFIRRPFREAPIQEASQPSQYSSQSFNAGNTNINMAKLSLESPDKITKRTNGILYASDVNFLLLYCAANRQRIAEHNSNPVLSWFALRYQGVNCTPSIIIIGKIRLINLLFFKNRADKYSSAKAKTPFTAVQIFHATRLLPNKYPAVTRSVQYSGRYLNFISF